jgi:hypothetical protein
VAGVAWFHPLLVAPSGTRGGDLGFEVSPRANMPLGCVCVHWVPGLEAAGREIVPHLPT